MKSNGFKKFAISGFWPIQSPVFVPPSIYLTCVCSTQYILPHSSVSTPFTHQENSKLSLSTSIGNYYLLPFVGYEATGGWRSAHNGTKTRWMSLVTFAKVSRDLAFIFIYIDEKERKRKNQKKTLSFHRVGMWKVFNKMKET